MLALNAEEGWLLVEWIEGECVREILNRGVQSGDGWRRVMRAVGREVGGLHSVGVVHGDLTTSNMMVRGGGSGGGGGKGEGEVVLIDFGLAGQSSHEEDRAVDLYVLERALGSTHPEAGEEGFAEVLRGYGEGFPGGAKVVLKRLEDVRLRGRKRSMLG